jgi:hypothetical protein
MVLPPGLVTQTLTPSKTMPNAPLPAKNEPMGKPSLARSFVTLFETLFATHTLAPSKAMPLGEVPTGNTSPVWLA